MRKRDLDKSVRIFREFNRRYPKKLRVIEIDDDSPLIKIGKVPLMTYISKKTGTVRKYAHRTKDKPTLYMHPSLPFGIIVGGSIKIRKGWLQD